MCTRHERRRPRHARPVVSLNLQQVNYHTGGPGCGHAGPMLQQDRNISATPDTPPPPYEVHDFATMQSGNRVADERSARQHSSKSRNSPPVNTTTESSERLDSVVTAHRYPNNTVGPFESASYSQDPIVRSMNQSAVLCDQVASVAARLSVVFTNIDEGEVDIEDPFTTTTTTRGSLPRDADPPTRAKRSLIDFSKTWLYANSRLPPHMPPFKVYISTWQIICAAAQASNDVYHRVPPHFSNGSQDPRHSSGTSSAPYIDASVWHGTKAMTLHTQQVEVTDKRLVVLAIRGSKWNPVDWAVNFRPAPTVPSNFLDDDGNACHAGFLGVARNMLAPVAARLRAFVEAASAPTEWSLLLTGHSAGGAVASLLYSHMLSTTRESELSVLAGCFKRVHCVTFGAPPVSLLPLRKPEGPRFAKSVFLGFANEGDPVVRADRQYVHTLVRLLAAPAPAEGRGGGGSGNGSSRTKRRAPATWWEVPASTLSNAGRMVLLREKLGRRRREAEAVQVTDEELRIHVFGDPAMHSMELYKLRVDELAVEAITGRRSG